MSVSTDIGNPFYIPPIYQTSCQFLAVYLGMQFQLHPVTVFLTVHQT